MYFFIDVGVIQSDYVFSDYIPLEFIIRYWVLFPVLRSKSLLILCFMDSFLTPHP